MPQKNSAKRKGWQKKIKNWQESGLSAQKWCLENGENYHYFKQLQLYEKVAWKRSSHRHFLNLCQDGFRLRLP